MDERSIGSQIANHKGSVMLLDSTDFSLVNQTSAATSKVSLASSGHAVNDSHQMELGLWRVRQHERKWMRTSSIEKQPAGKSSDPALSAPELLRSANHAVTEPPGPVSFRGARGAEAAVLV